MMAASVEGVPDTSDASPGWAEASGSCGARPRWYDEPKMAMIFARRIVEPLLRVQVAMAAVRFAK